ADDLRSHLASEPIRARRDSLGRRTTRVLRRHAALAIAGLVGALALAAVRAPRVAEPIRALRDSLGRRTTRFLRRHATLAIAGLVGALALAAGAGFFPPSPAAVPPGAARAG